MYNCHVVMKSQKQYNAYNVIVMGSCLGLARTAINATLSKLHFVDDIRDCYSFESLTCYAP